MDEVLNDGIKMDSSEPDADAISLGADSDGDEEDGLVNPMKFLDNEAELSGDEGSSDEDEDGDDNDEDILGTKEADNEDVDESEQREKIAKMFHKQQADEDRRDILLYQEKLFEDGDLHMDGKMRQRRFKWRNVQQTWLDPNINSSDEDDDDDENKMFEMPIRKDEVVINYKKDFPEDDVKDDTNDSQSGQIQTKTIPKPVFGGPADSIESYLVRDKKTCEMLSKKKASPAMELFLKKNVKKHKIRTKRLFNN